MNTRVVMAPSPGGKKRPSQLLLLLLLPCGAERRLGWGSGTFVDACGCRLGSGWMPSPYRARDYQSQLYMGCCREEPGASTNDEEVRPRPFLYESALFYMMPACLPRAR
jgi:hypothetical protein